MCHHMVTAVTCRSVTIRMLLRVVVLLTAFRPASRQVLGHAGLLHSSFQAMDTSLNAKSIVLVAQTAAACALVSLKVWFKL